MKTEENRDIYSGKKLHLLHLTFLSRKEKPKFNIKHSRSLSYSQRVFRVEPIITMLATQYGA